MEITLDEEGFDLSAYEQQQGPKWENAQSRYFDRYFFFQHPHGISKCFIKPLICPFTHTFTHTFTHQLAAVAMQGTGRPIASNLGLSVGFKPLNPSTTVTPPLHHHHYYHHHQHCASLKAHLNKNMFPQADQPPSTHQVQTSQFPHRGSHAMGIKHQQFNMGVGAGGHWAGLLTVLSWTGHAGSLWDAGEDCERTRTWKENSTVQLFALSSDGGGAEQWQNILRFCKIQTMNRVICHQRSNQR